MTTHNLTILGTSHLPHSCLRAQFLHLDPIPLRIAVKFSFTNRLAHRRLHLCHKMNLFPIFKSPQRSAPSKAVTRLSSEWPIADDTSRNTTQSLESFLAWFRAAIILGTKLSIGRISWDIMRGLSMVSLVGVLLELLRTSFGYSIYGSSLTSQHSGAIRVSSGDYLDYSFFIFQAIVPYLFSLLFWSDIWRVRYQRGIWVKLNESDDTILSVKFGL